MTIPILLSLFCCLLEILFLRQRSAGNHIRALILKVLASLCFCLVGIWGSICRGWGFVISAGLVCGLLGDLLLGLRKLRPHHHDLIFVAGALAFSLGHVLYSYALVRLQSGLLLPSLPIFLILVLLSELFARKSGFSQGNMHIPGLFYIGVEGVMCALALSAYGKNPTLGTGLFALGGISFLVSDNLLCAFSFGSLRNSFTDRLLHATYLMAQLFIAWSIFFL